MCKSKRKPVHGRVQAVQWAQRRHLEPAGHSAAVEQGQAGLVFETAGITRRLKSVPG
jgi:hypothetical protein